MNIPNTYTSTSQSGLPLPIRLLPLFVLVFVLVGGFGASRLVRGQLATADLSLETLHNAESQIQVAANNVMSSAATALAPQPASNARFVGLPISTIAAAFMPSVRFWGPQIEVWAAEHGVDPNLAATVMQIESCGHPTVVSRSGAQGLFQVMPFHFAAGEVMTDPSTNADRGLAYLALGLDIANGNTGLAMAGYNGGHSVIGRSSGAWAHETQRYYYWGTGIYAEVQADPNTSPRLQEWLQAGGYGLCQQAEQVLGIANTN